MEQKRARRAGRPVLVVVLLLVNAAAMWGQAGWGLDHIVPATWTDWRAGLVLALGFAAAIELIGVFLSISADDAEDQDLPSGGIRLLSYCVGLLSGALNFSHWSGAAAIAFGLLSTISPFLWGINSRVNRSRPIAPSRRLWHPRRSITLIRHMAWEGIALESEGILSLAERKEIIHVDAGTVPEPIAALTAPAREQDAGAVLVHGEARDAGAMAKRTRAGAPAELEKAVRMLLEGASVEEVAAATGLGGSTLRRYTQVMRVLRDDPQADDFGSATGKVKPDMVAIIRDTMNRERAL